MFIYKLGLAHLESKQPKKAARLHERQTAIRKDKGRLNAMHLVTPQSKPRLVSTLNPKERDAVLEFTDRIVKTHGPRVASISLYETGQKTPDGSQDFEILVMSSRKDAALESDVLDLVAEIAVETDVLLTVKCLSQRLFERFRKAGLPFVHQILAKKDSLFTS